MIIYVIAWLDHLIVSTTLSHRVPVKDHRASTVNTEH